MLDLTDRQATGFSSAASAVGAQISVERALPQETHVRARCLSALSIWPCLTLPVGHRLPLQALAAQKLVSKPTPEQLKELAKNKVSNAEFKRLAAVQLVSERELKFSVRSRLSLRPSRNCISSSPARLLAALVYVAQAKLKNEPLRLLCGGHGLSTSGRKVCGYLLLSVQCGAVRCGAVRCAVF